MIIFSASFFEDCKDLLVIEKLLRTKTYFKVVVSNIFIFIENGQELEGFVNSNL